MKLGAKRISQGTISYPCTFFNLSTLGMDMERMIVLIEGAINDGLME